MKRKLGQFEIAAAISGEYAVWNIVGVLALENGPAAEHLRPALDHLQARHPMLNARLVREGRQPNFIFGDAPPIPLKILGRADASHWIQVAEQELNLGFDHPQGPLLRCSYLSNGQGPADLVLTAQHCIADGASIEALFKELLDVCASLEAGGAPPRSQAYPPLPAVEDRFPAAFQGGRLRRKTLGYFLSQMADEFRYQFSLIGKRKPPLQPQATGYILHQKTSPELTAQLVARTRKERVTLNSLINAALLLSVQKHLYGGAGMPFRYMSMADLRPYLSEPPDRDEIACYISPLRYTIEIPAGEDLWGLAKRINAQIYQSAKRGEKFLASVMARQFLQMTFSMKKFRMSTTALSFGGSTALEQYAGSYKITGLHGYVSNFGMGPEFSGRVGLFQDQLNWDLLYMDIDLDQAGADAIMADIQERLADSIK